MSSIEKSEEKEEKEKKEEKEEKEKENENYSEIEAALLGKDNNHSEQQSFLNSFILKNPLQQENESFNFGPVNTVNKNDTQFNDDLQKQKMLENSTTDNKVENKNEEKSKNIDDEKSENVSIK